MRQKEIFNEVKEFLIEEREKYYRVAFYYVKNKDDALDIVQESICKALASKSTINDAAKIKTWFYRIVVNTSLDFIKKSKRHVYVEDDVLEFLCGGSEDDYHDFDLETAIEALPLKNKTIIILRYFQNMKIDEIAFIINENINTVKTRLYKTLKMLRIDLEREI